MKDIQQEIVPLNPERLQDFGVEKSLRQKRPSGHIIIQQRYGLNRLNRLSVRPNLIR